MRLTPQRLMGHSMVAPLASDIAGAIHTVPLYVNATEAKNVGTTLTSLMSYELPANTLAEAGDRIVMTATIRVSSLGVPGARFVAFYIDGDYVWSWGESSGNAALLGYEVTMVRINATTVTLVFRMITEADTSFSECDFTTYNYDLSQSMIIEVAGQSAKVAGQDITQGYMAIDFIAAP